jgi:hypothetical protein
MGIGEDLGQEIAVLAARLAAAPIGCSRAFVSSTNSVAGANEASLLCAAQTI